MSQSQYEPSRFVLRLVQSLHVRGYQRLRIAPGMSPSGMHWRCTITPVTNVSRKHGARLVDFNKLTAHYSSAGEREYFGWEDARHASPDRLAELFIKRFPEIATAGQGSDWLYVGWYVEMLHLTYPWSFPVGYADRELPAGVIGTVGESESIRIPMPPPGDADGDGLVDLR